MTDSSVTFKTEGDKFIYIGRDGGTGKHTAPDFRSAYAGVSASDRRRAYIMLGAAGVTVGVLLLSRLIWLFKPLFDLVYYATLSKIIYYIIIGLLYTGFVIALNEFIKNKCDVRLFRRRGGTVNAARALGVIALSAVMVFIVSAAMGFKLKMQREMGMGVTMATALTNISVYFYYAFHMWLGFVAASLVQYGMSILFPAKYTLPWGALFLVTVYGLLELLFEVCTTDHLYAGYYYLLTYAYAAIYVLTGRSFHVSYWASVIVMIL